MVRFDRIMEIMEEDALLHNTRTVGNHLLKRLETIADSNDHLSNARGRGLMCAIDVSTRSLRDELLKLCRENGLLVIGCGQSTIRFRPPLIITQNELDFGMDIFERVVQAGCTAKTKTSPDDSGILSPK